MEKLIKPIFILMVFGVISHTAVSQGELTEDDMPLGILTWFYKDYSNSENIKWSQVQGSDETLYRVVFVNGEAKIISIYNNKGEILEESRTTKKPALPYEIDSYAISKYGKYKALTLRRLTKFSHNGTQNKEVYFELLCKKGSEVHSVWFDDKFNIQGKGTDFSKYASN